MIYFVYSKVLLILLLLRYTKSGVKKTFVFTARPNTCSLKAHSLEGKRRSLLTD